MSSSMAGPGEGPRSIALLQRAHPRLRQLQVHGHGRKRHEKREEIPHFRGLFPTPKKLQSLPPNPDTVLRMGNSLSVGVKEDSNVAGCFNPELTGYLPKV